jgi:hypothetical protein
MSQTRNCLLDLLEIKIYSLQLCYSAQNNLFWLYSETFSSMISNFLSTFTQPKPTFKDYIESLKTKRLKPDRSTLHRTKNSSRIRAASRSELCTRSARWLTSKVRRATRTDHRSVGWSLVVESVHTGLSPRLGMGAYIFLDLFQDLTLLCFQW